MIWIVACWLNSCWRITGHPVITECRVEMWRGGLGLAYPFPALSSAGASLSRPYAVSTSRSSNRTCTFRASGSRRKHHDFAHEKLRFR